MGFSTLVTAAPERNTGLSDAAIDKAIDDGRPTFTKAELLLIKPDDAALAEADARATPPADADKGEKGALGKHRAEGGDDAEAVTEDDDLAKGQELTDLGRDALASFQEHAVETRMSKKAVQGVLTWWDRTVAEYNARRKNNDAAVAAQASKALKAQWGADFDANLAVAKEVFRSLPTDLRKVVREARTPDGTRLEHLPEFVDWLRQMGSKGWADLDAEDDTGRKPDADRKDMVRHRAALQRELDAIDTLMKSDVDTYHRAEWRHTGKTASERKRELLVLLDKVGKGEAPSPRHQREALAEERRELDALAERDPEVFEHREFRNTGRTGAERLEDIRRGRAA